MPHKDPDKRRAYQREWYRRNRDRHLARMQRWRSSDYQKNRQYFYDLYYRYGLTKEEYEGLRKEQGGRCAICRDKVSLNVDHDHKTGAVRGLLCRPCNWMLGYAKDRTDVLARGISYLENSRKQ